MKKLIAILLVALMALSLVACNRTPADLSTAIIGSWELDDAEGEETKQAVAMMKLFGMSMILEFHEDGTGKMISAMGEEEEVTEFNYQIKDNQIVIDESPAEFKIVDKELHISLEGEMMIFKKK